MWIVPLTLSMKKYYGYKSGELWSMDVSTATNFVARDGDKLAYNSAIIICAGIL